ncbi:MAG TPA: ribbon-helix-helix domain-containing protein [Pedomonas sp.]|nr:ribbon-helix-helix domain-containing protein [Pedomonas sp.]
MKKRSVTIAGHRTSLSLESEFWELLQAAANEEGMPLAQLVARIDEERTTNLSSAVRVWLLRRLLARLEACGGTVLAASPPPARPE